jgi:hypothetical protein
MELSDEKVLETLLRTWEQHQLGKKGGRPRRAETPPSYNTPSLKSMRRCKCGVCPKCEDNARWERIFQEKFADPEYYGRRHVPHVSPLAD